jgi:hypothetical protein
MMRLLWMLRVLRVLRIGFCLPPRLQNKVLRLVLFRRRLALFVTNARRRLGTGQAQVLVWRHLGVWRYFGAGLAPLRSLYYI